MSNRQGNLKDYQGNKIVPNTSSVAVLDEARQQALSASLLALVEKNALGFPTFSTVSAYSEGDKVFYDRKLWKFTADHAAGDWDANDVEEFSLKEYTDALANEVETVKSEYLKKGTYSADTAVGLADNLRGQTVDSEAYLIRPTGGAENEVANGVASVLGMEGNSCVWNQILKITETRPSILGFSVTNTNTSITINGTGQVGDVYLSHTNDPIISTHKYYVKYTSSIDVSSNIKMYQGTKYSSALSPGIGRIISGSSMSQYLTFQCIAPFDTATTVRFDFMYIDLTLLEIDNLTTVAAVEAWLAQHVGTKPSYAYNAGTILSAQTLGIKTYGQNLLNPTTKQARLIPYTWEENSNVYTIKNVPSGATATFTPDATGVAETVDISGGSLDITSYGSGILELSAATANTYVCMKWDEQKDDDVVPYEDHTYDFDEKKVYGKVSGAGEYVQCFPNDMMSAGNTHDILSADMAVSNVDKKYLSDFGVWGWNSNQLGFSSPTLSKTIIKTRTSGLVQMFCSRYLRGICTSSNSGIVNASDLTINFYNNVDYDRLTIKDSRYNAETIEAFRNSIANVELTFERQYPITYTDLIYRDNGVDTPLADVLMNITVNNWSMEEQLVTPYDEQTNQPTSIPATIKTQYGMDAVEAIDTLQKTCYFADDVKANLQALLTCINTNCAETLGGTFSISDTATDKVFAFTFTPNPEPDVEPTNEGE